jgi:hypothetical protein
MRRLACVLVQYVCHSSGGTYGTGEGNPASNRPSIAKMRTPARRAAADDGISSQSSAVVTSVCT